MDDLQYVFLLTALIAVPSQILQSLLRVPIIRKAFVTNCGGPLIATVTSICIQRGRVVCFRSQVDSACVGRVGICCLVLCTSVPAAVTMEGTARGHY